MKAAIQEMLSGKNGQVDPQLMLKIESLKSEQELLSFIKSNRGEIYSYGANWSGWATAGRLTLAVLIAEVLVGLANYKGL